MEKFELEKIEQMDAVEVFKKGGVDPILDAIREAVDSHVPDTSTTKGRKAIASLSSKVSSARARLEEAGKSLVIDIKKEAATIDAERKRIREELAEIRDKAREPLTLWEKEEEERVEAQRLAEEVMQAHIEAINMNEMFDKEKEIAVREAAIARVEEERKQKEEADRLERERIEREAKIKLKAEEEAKLKAQEEIERIKREKQEAIDRAEKDRLQAIEDIKNAEIEAAKVAERKRIEAEQEKDRAIQAERDRIEAEKLADKIATEKREADKKHKAKINNAALEAIISCCGLNKDQAKKTITAIAKGEVPHVHITY
jgi:hypothetical protein